MDKDQELRHYRKKLQQHRELETRLRKEREALNEAQKQFDKSEDDLKALQSVGQVGCGLTRQHIQMLPMIFVRFFKRVEQEPKKSCQEQERE